MTRKISQVEQLSEAELVYMSEIALEFAQAAQESGRSTLANIFRMAALEAADVKPEISREVRTLLGERTTH